MGEVGKIEQLTTLPEDLELKRAITKQRWLTGVQDKDMFDDYEQMDILDKFLFYGQRVMELRRMVSDIDEALSRIQVQGAEVEGVHFESEELRDILVVKRLNAKAELEQRENYITDFIKAVDEQIPFAHRDICER